MAAFNDMSSERAGASTASALAGEEDEAAGHPHAPDVLVLCGLLLVYVIAGKAGLLFALIDRSVTPVWPPTGIALAACLLFGYRVWPALLAGAFVVNVTTPVSAAAALAIAAGNTLEALCGAYLVNRFAHGVLAFNRPRDIFKFTILAAMLSTMLSASIGAVSLWAAGRAAASDLGGIWFTWWWGDAAGDLIFAPLLVLWGVNPRLNWNRAQFGEALLSLVLLVMVAGLVFGNVLPLDLQHRPISFLCIPFLIWPAFRFGPRETAAASFLLFAIALAGTVNGYGPFAGDLTNPAFLVLLGFLAVLSLTAVSVAAGVVQRRIADQVRAGLAAIVDSSDDAIIGKTLDGTITSWNASAQRMFGYSEAEAIGQPIGIIIPPEEMENEQAQVLEVLRRGEAVKLADTVRVHKNGELIPVSLAVSPIKDSSGNIMGASSIARDISEHKRLLEALRASEEKFHQMADTVPDILFTTRSDGVTDYLNQRFFDYTGMVKEPREDYSWGGTLLFEDTESAIQKWHRSLERGQSFQAEFRLRATNGSYRWFMVRARPVRGDDGRIVKWFGACTDIEEQKLAEHEREERLRAEQAARGQAEAASRAKDEFLAMLGHELRNPLGAVLSAMEILEHFGSDAARSARARVIMSRQLRHLVRLVDGLLDVARVTTGKIELVRQPLDLGELVKVCTNALGERLAPYTLTLELEPVWVDGDPTRLEQVINNLLRNAADYTPAGGTIRISVIDENGSAAIRIEDTGVGISPELLPRIFDLFVQDKRGLDRSTGGLGIGLTLARRLIELHGGSVEASSAGRGLGSTFTVRLPRLRAAQAQHAGESAPAGAALARRVLIVEDNADARETLRDVLELAGHEVYEAADGAAGVAQALQRQPDVAFVDIGLPQLDGYEVARRIRRHPAGRDIFLIALSGYGQPDHLSQATEAGFDAHLVKPVDLARINEIMATWSRDASGGAAPASTARGSA